MDLSGDPTFQELLGQHELEAALEHDASRFDRGAAERLASRWLHWLEGALANPGQRLSALLG